MSATYSSLTQSKFFHPAFNSAIFDGPVRIYFAQFHEALALKIYFCLQQKYSDLIAAARKTHLKTGRSLLVMLYPTNESFKFSFEKSSDFLDKEDYLEDVVIGINGPFEDENLEKVLFFISDVLISWKDKGKEKDKESFYELC